MERRMIRSSIISCGRCTVEGRWSIDRNRTFNRLYYVNSGSAVILNGKDEHTLTAGKVYLIPRCKTFEPLNADGFDHTFFDFYSSLVLRPDKIIELDGSDIYATAFFEYIDRILAGGLGSKLVQPLELFLSGFLSMIEAEHGELLYVTSPSLTTALDIIHSEYHCVTTERLAKRLSLEKSYFIRTFSAAMGISPMKYIRSVRVAQGKLLIQNGASIAEAAERCGYSSPSAFYNATVAELGISPSSMRLSRRKGHII